MGNVRLFMFGENMSKQTFTILILSAILAFDGLSEATTRQVPSEYSTIQSAIDACSNGDTVIVAESTYYENLYIDKNIILTSTNPNDPNIVAATIILGNSLSRVLSFGGDEDPNCLLTGFTITGENWDPFNGNKGGIYGAGTHATIDSCLITGNHADSSDIPAHNPVTGAGLSDCDGTISNCTITGNYLHPDISSGIDGQGAGLYDCDGTIINCTISGNYGGDTSDGGGLYGCDGTITNCTISENDVEWGGGGGLAYCNAAVTNCVISSNCAITSRGGGFYACGGSITDCTITGNYALPYQSYGGGGGLSNCNAAVTNCVISLNISPQYGGGIESCGGSFTNCTITGNTAGMGAGFGNCSAVINKCVISNNIGDGAGGIFGGSGLVINCLIANNTGIGICESGSPIINCTITGNYFDGSFIAGLCDCTNEIKNCIISNNNSEVWPPPYDLPEYMQIYECSVPSFSCIQDWTSGGTGNINADPNFVDPANNDYHLKSQAGHWDETLQSWITDSTTSPCIDAGSPLTSIGWEPYPNGGIVNMGAYGGTEYTSKSYFGTATCESPIVGDVNGDCLVDLIDFSLMAFHWLEDNRK
jgi:Disaggregatase related/Right handed beta helix region